MLFVPYALYDRDAYAVAAQQRFQKMGGRLDSIHTMNDPRQAANEAESFLASKMSGELGEVIAGVKPCRTSADEIIICDSTGMALQDVVAAVAVYEKAVSHKIGTLIDFGY